MNQVKTIATLIQAAPMLAAIGEEMSFTKAAEKLKVDQSAVSHRIKSLEAALGHTLFDRTTRRLQFTEAGEILCRAALDTFITWDRALDKLERIRTTDLIQLSLSSSLAMKWLIPTLPSAQAWGLNISLEVKEETVDFHVNEADAAIRFGHGPYPGLHSSHLSHCWLQPVASSKYLNQHTDDTSFLTDPETTTLTDRRGESDKTDFSWNYYFSTLGLSMKDFNSTHKFDRADLMIQAAVGGLGVGLGRTLLIESDIKAEYLEAFGAPVRMKSAYWLVCSPSFAETDRFKKLHDWLKVEIQKTIGNTRNDTV